MATLTEVFAFIDRGMAFMTRPVRGEPQGYAHLYRIKGGYELLLSEHPGINRGAHTRIEVGSVDGARAIAHRLGCKPWNF